MGARADEVVARAVRVARLAVDLGADQHLAARRLRQVEEQIGRGDDGLEAALVVVGDEGLQRVRADRQPETRHRRQRGDVAAHRRDHAPGGDPARRRLDADHLSAVERQTGHRRALVDVDAAAHGALGVGPHHPVVPRRRGVGVVAGAEDRPHSAAGEVELGTDLGDALGLDELGAGATGGVDLGAGALGAHPHLAVRQPQEALPLVHHRAPGLLLERVVELERALVEAHRLGDAVVGADHRRVAARVAAADVAALEHRDVGDAVARGEVIGGGQPVPAAADDHHVVGALRLGPGERDEALDVLVQSELLAGIRSSRSAA